MKTTTKPYTPSALRREIQSRAFTRRAGYHVDVSWRYLEEWITSQAEINLNLDPDFQRAHVWTRQQQTAYVEYVLRGGEAAKRAVLQLRRLEPPARPATFVIVDGKQRTRGRPAPSSGATCRSSARRCRSGGAGAADRDVGPRRPDH
jgi:hypothetical protein